jgi:hypothetical protein
VAIIILPLANLSRVIKAHMEINLSGLTLERLQMPGCECPKNAEHFG